MHYVNLAWVIDIVNLVQGYTSSDDALATCTLPWLPFYWRRELINLWYGTLVKETWNVTTNGIMIYFNAHESTLSNLDRNKDIGS